MNERSCGLVKSGINVLTGANLTGVTSTPAVSMNAELVRDRNTFSAAVANILFTLMSVISSLDSSTVITSKPATSSLYLITHPVNGSCAVPAETVELL